MGLVQKLKDMFTEYDDEYERTTEDAPMVDDFDQLKRESSSPSAYDSYEQDEQPTITSNGNRSKVVNIHATTQLQVVLVKPERFEDARGIAPASECKTNSRAESGVSFQRIVSAAAGLFKRRCFRQQRRDPESGKRDLYYPALQCQLDG